VRQQSAGLVLFRRRPDGLEVLLIHPGGPFWSRRDLGAWSIPKGGYQPGEAPIDAARREFQEETGFSVDGPFLPLKPVRQAGGKVVTAWAVEGDLDASAVHSTTFSMEWPPKSGRQREFPEVDRAEWFPLRVAEEKILAGQRPLIEELPSVVDSPVNLTKRES
jgi:predicted NUDIX family NTP pyrophosphohydrolase